MDSPVSQLNALGTATPAPPKQKISNGLYVRYGIGAIGERMFRDTPALLLLVFMTNYLGIPPALAGVVVFVPKLIVVFVDPLVGIYSDRIRSSWGRRRPPMLLGALLTSASFILMFYVPRIDDLSLRSLYMFAAITIGFCAYSLFSVPYLTMASEMAANAAERTRLMSMRVIFMAIGLTAGAYAGAVVQYGGGGAAGYRFMAGLWAAVSLLTMLVTVFGTSKARQGDPDTAPLSLFDQFRMAWRNIRYRLLIAMNFLQKTGEGIGYGSAAYFFAYWVHKPLSSLGLVVLCGTIGQIISQPFWVWLNGRTTRNVVYIVGILGWCFNLIIYLFMEGAPTWLFALTGVEGGIACGGFLSVVLMMLADSIARDAKETGVEREGTYSGIWLATEKIGFAFGALLVGLMLGLFGFKESTGGLAAEQPHSAVIGIALIYAGINVAIYLLSIVPVLRYQRLARA